jgi:uncharacterized membrane protein
MSAQGPHWLIVGIAVVLIAATESLRMAGFQNALFMVAVASLTSAAVLVVRPWE